MVKRHKMSILTCHNNGNMDSVGSWSKKKWMSGLIEEQLQQLNIGYPQSEHSRALDGVRLGFEEPFDDDGPVDD
ncbi:hypothetical protein HAX54_051369 [Datura stramonium]|uniref:Uncharacterized protein n=1 Tax=Datura stramonium TaxID=4076 RepID=A0ABS8SYH1_DATST|nr:hypothetical protein [Datura stramonium]